MKKYLFFLSCFFLAINFCEGQQDNGSVYVSHSTLQNSLKVFRLFDKEQKTSFILDSMQIQITALDSNGKQLWQTDPWKDNNLTEYRVKRPLIVRFYFISNKRTDNRDVIWIVYNNSQFGFIDKWTGKFKWIGQD